MTEGLEQSFHALGSSNSIRILAESEARAKEIAYLVIEEIRRIERKYSRYQPESIVAKINAAAGGDPVQVDEETARMIDFAHECAAQSGGAFDITSGVLRTVWDFRSNKIPDSEAVKALLPRIGLHLVEWRPPFFRLPLKGMEIDFGGFGKEYATDRAAMCARNAGASGGYINLGGDVSVIGPRNDNKPWCIGIQHPRNSKVAIASVEVKAGALATSGDYERFMEIDGKRYCHLLDPRTGWPVSDFQSVSVLAGSCLIAGTVATITMLKGYTEGVAYLRESNLPALIVDANGKCSRIGWSKSSEPKR